MAYRTSWVIKTSDQKYYACLLEKSRLLNLLDGFPAADDTLSVSTALTVPKHFKNTRRGS